MDRDKILRSLAGMHAGSDAQGQGASTRQIALYEGLQSNAAKYGKFDWSTGPDGAQYLPGGVNPYEGQGLECENCLFWVGNSNNENPDNPSPGACKIVDGQIDADGLCKFWVIPADKINTQATDEPRMSDDSYM